MYRWAVSQSGVDSAGLSGLAAGRLVFGIGRFGTFWLSARCFGVGPAAKGKLKKLQSLLQ